MHQRGTIQFPCVTLVTGRKETNKVAYLDYDRDMSKDDWIQYIKKHEKLIDKDAQLYIVTARSYNDFDSSMYPQDIKETK